MARYRVLQGIDYPPNKRVEAGEIATDLPAQSVKWLLESGIIEDADKPTKQEIVEAPKVEEPVIEEPIVEEPKAEAPSAEAEEGDE
jgi:hypothetical protein